MKTRFNTYDILCGVAELQKLVGLRVNQIYDIDNKTYLIRLQQADKKVVLLLESGIRFHTTVFEWPKNVAPSGFSMKLRKHLKNKRLEKVEQLGIDRIVHFQFGSGEVAYHIILELYDRGNIVLADHEFTILNILRPHNEGEEIRFAVKEKYPLSRAKMEQEILTEARIIEIIENVKHGEYLRKVIVPYLGCGPAVLEHVFIENNLADCWIPEKLDATETGQQSLQKGKKKKKPTGISMREFNINVDLKNLLKAITEANEILTNAKKETCKGYIIQKAETRASENYGENEIFYHNLEYHPKLFAQHSNQIFKVFDTFLSAVDEFYSSLEGQKIDLKAVQQEKDALKKLSNVKKDHAKRLVELSKVQTDDRHKAELITRNKDLVDSAILAIHNALASQISWENIHELVKAAQLNGDQVAMAIKQLKLEINHITLNLNDPYENESDSSEDKSDNDTKLKPMLVDVDLALSAFGNATKYYDRKRTAAKKEQRTVDASQKALKSAERKTRQTLKEVRTISTISKARKVYWFEKFYWFISSENYLVIAGRDSQQNELIVKRYMRSNDIYVHAEIQGASSVVIRNPSGNDIPPKTLLEAGTMAISYSVAWDAKVVTNAYWVRSDQVSKTAPTGEYLGTGSFMIRGKKNFLPDCHLIMGLSLLFKLEDGSIARHKNERKIRNIDDDLSGKLNDILIENKQLMNENEQEIDLNDSEEENENTKNPSEHLETISEESDNKDLNNFKYPDTHIKVEHDTGNVTIQIESKDILSQDALGISKEIEDDKVYIIPAIPTKKKQLTNKKKKEEKKSKTQQNQINIVDNSVKNTNQPKRRQKGKLKKMKSKYKDQDEEERELRMQILKSAGTIKPNEQDDNNIDVNSIKPPKKVYEPKIPNDLDDADETGDNADVDMLDSLTGNPVEEDEILFAVPIVSPYQAMQNYKYKIKLTPGTGKRGKASKTALLMFAKDKSSTTREKDLIKSIKEESLARNIPGKVKLSAPQLQKFKK